MYSSMLDNMEIQRNTNSLYTQNKVLIDNLITLYSTGVKILIVFQISRKN